LNIGQAAAASGVSTKMIRHYEGIGLIRSAARTQAGYRIYSEHDLHTLLFIRRARDLGFSVEQIRALLLLWHDHSRASADVKRIALGHIEALEAKMLQLQSMADTLRHLVENCHGDNRPDCPIIHDLAVREAERAGDRRPRTRRGALKGTLIASR
jgi:MerR family transcriptional regulator, copper efflux regulator